MLSWHRNFSWNLTKKPMRCYRSGARSLRFSTELSTGADGHCSAEAAENFRVLTRLPIIQNAAHPAHHPRISRMPQEVASELAPTGVLRAAINMGNALLVTGRTASGDPAGVAPDMAREIASRLGRAGRLCSLCAAGRAGGCGGKRRLGHRADRRRAAARREDRLHARLCRDRGDLSGAGGLAPQNASPRSTAPACASR